MAANKNPTVISTGSPKNQIRLLEGWVAYLVVWAASIGMVLSIVCFMLGRAE